MSDFKLFVCCNGHNAILPPQTDDGRAWAREHLPTDDYEAAGLDWLDGISVEQRFVPPILEGIDRDGLLYTVAEERR